jgi:DNA-binding response OmpR family regulator
MRITLARYRRVVTSALGSVELPPEEFDVLWRLAVAAPGAVARPALADAVGARAAHDVTIVSDVVRSLRSLLAPVGADALIATERGVGYRVAGSVAMEPVVGDVLVVEPPA